MDRWLAALLPLLLLATAACAAPGIRAASLEAASLQLGALQAQAQYAPSALQSQRKASRSAASCLVTAVQYTHGQQIWRADPCEFCLCLDGEMFCWWQECPPEAPGPCPSGQPYSLCGNSSLSFDKAPSPVVPTRKLKKVSYRKTLPTLTSETTTPRASTTHRVSKPLITTTSRVVDATPEDAADDEQFNKLSSTTSKVSKPDKRVLKDKPRSKDKWNGQGAKASSQSYTTSNEYGSNSTMADQQPTASIAFDETTGNSSSTQDNSTAAVPVFTKSGCLVMGTEYQVGQALPSTGSCLACRCSEGGSVGARVTCAPRGCAPLDSTMLADDPESF